MNRARNIARAHKNGQRPSEHGGSTAVATERVEIVSNITRAENVPYGLRCELTVDCKELVTDQVKVRIDGELGLVYGCLEHLVLWVKAEPDGPDG